jgi:hypothetical protein
MSFLSEFDKRMLQFNQLYDETNYRGYTFKWLKDGQGRRIGIEMSLRGLGGIDPLVQSYFDGTIVSYGNLRNINSWSAREQVKHRINDIAYRVMANEEERWVMYRRKPLGNSTMAAGGEDFCSYLTNKFGGGASAGR